ncbi:hypothetical protein EV122DRAFT_280019 [Schizophyllum commune]
MADICPGSFKRSYHHSCPSNKLLNKWYPEFQRNFSAVLKDAKWQGDEHKSFRQYFHNHKARKLAKLAKAGSAPTTAPSTAPHKAPAASSPASLLLPFLGKSAAVSARSLFESSARAEISAEVTNIRNATGVDHKAHCGMVNHELKSRWESMSQDERESFEEQARCHNEKLTSQVYINQKQFVEQIPDALDALLGSGDRQLGKGALLLMYGLRQENDRLYTGVIQAGSTFNEEFDGYRAMTKAWQTHCHKVIPVNHPIDKPVTSSAAKLVRDPSGVPSWPADWEKYSASDLKAILRDFIAIQWQLALDSSLSTRFPSTIPDDPSAYLGVQFPFDIALRDPTTARSSYCSELAEAFDILRTESPYFRLFRQAEEVQEETSTGVGGSTEDIDGLNPAALDHYEYRLDDEEHAITLGNTPLPQSRDDAQHQRSHNATPAPQTPSPVSDAQTVAATPSARSTAPSLSLPASPSSLHTHALRTPSCEDVATSTIARKSSETGEFTVHLEPTQVEPATSEPTSVADSEGQVEPFAAQSSRGEPLPALSTPSQLPSSFGVTGRRDYSPRKTRARAAQAKNQEASTILDGGSSNVGKRQADSELRIEEGRGKRQKLAAIAVQRSTASQQARATVLVQASDPVSSASKVPRREQPKRARKGRATNAKQAEQSNFDDDTIVTARGKRTKRKAKHWEYVPILD